MTSSHVCPRRTKRNTSTHAMFVIVADLSEWPGRARRNAIAQGSLCPRVSPVLDFAALALRMMCEGHERMLFWASGA